MGARAPATEAASATNEISVDPLDAPPPPMAAAAAPAASEPAAPAQDPLLLVPTQNQASQRVPLGTLNASSDPAPAAKPPTPLAAKSAASAPAPTPPTPPPAPAQTAAAPPPSAPVVAKPPVNSIPTSTQAAGSLTSPRGMPARTEAPAVAPATAPAVETPVEPQPPSRAKELFSDEQETTIISSTTAPPAAQSREFIPAPVVPAVAAPAPPSLGEMPFSQAEKNIARRFETLSRLRDQGLVTQEEFTRRRAANLGAILPYSQDPPGVGLDRAVPSSDAIVARLGALRRSFEMRAITAQQHALERTMILNALLPENPEQRTARKPPPEDVIQGAAMVGHLEALREGSVISQSELDAEKRMIDAVLRTGLFPPKGGEPAAKPAQAKTAAKPAASSEAAAAEAGETPMTRQITGPVLHLASFRSEASAMRGWQEVLERNKATIASLKPIIRRVDLGEGKGIFYRLMMGSFTSMADAEATCVRLKQNNQFCRASADGS